MIVNNSHDYVIICCFISIKHHIITGDTSFKSEALPVKLITWRVQAVCNHNNKVDT